MLTTILIVVLLFILFVASRPSEFRVTRSGTMAAPPEKVFPHVNNLHNWEAWSPWAKLDPNAKLTFSGPESGAGAVMAWVGNCKVGTGRMTITESRPSELVRFKLEFEKPFKGTNLAEFAFKPEGQQTVVTWSMTGQSNFMGKLMGLLMNCEKMIGGNFEQGLAAINSVVKAG